MCTPEGNAYVPYDPLGTLKPVADDVFVVDGPEIGMRYLWFTLPFPTRMTIVRLGDGGLFVHSPIAPTPELLAAVSALGPVRHIVAPNTLHYWFVPDWHAAFPEARLHGVPGLAERAKRPLPPMAELTDTPDPAWAGDLDQCVVPGTAITEAVFFHGPSRTLILVDLIENFEPKRVKSRWLRTAMRLGGVADPDGRTPKDVQATFWPKRRAVREAIRRMLAWEPERVILAHGRWYESGGTEELRRAFRWIL